MYRWFLRTGHKAFLVLEDGLNKLLTPRYNPLHFMGAIAMFLLWVVLISGFYIFLFYRIDAQDAYPSVEALTHEQWWLGGIMRSLHRYASDGLVIATIIHTLHVYFTDRYRRFRWIAWVTGVMIFISIIPTGIVGYWMVWDMKGQMAALLTTDFFGFIPSAGEAIQRSFLNNTVITDNFFLAVLLIHVLLPVYLLAFLWLHVTRISRPVINPPKQIMYLIVIVLVVFSLIKPATSAPQGDLTTLFTSVPIDWFFLFYFPFIQNVPGWLSWGLMIGATALFTVIPWLVKSDKPAPAKVFLPKCTGCTQCYQDCPYEAIHMQKRTDGQHFDFEAHVIESRCASCGICVGACDFKAIDLQDRLSGEIRRKIVTQCSPEMRGGGEPTIIGFVCENSAPLDGLVDLQHDCLKEMPNVVILSFPCAGMIQSSMIELALKSGADGVFICGCQVGDCHYREGHKWMEGRLMHERMPYLKSNVDRTKVRAFWLSMLQTDKLLEGIKTFQEDLKTQKEEIPLFRTERFRKSAIIPAALLMLIPLIPIYFMADATYRFYPEDRAGFIFSIKHLGDRLVPCVQRTPEELAKLPYYQRKPMDCQPERHPVYVEMSLDGEKKVERIAQPSGFKKDGPVTIYNKHILAAGPHKVVIRMSNTGNPEAIDHVFDGTIELKEGKVTVIDFDEKKRDFVVD
ncbi:MAG: hydrogenase iron-sulfur subunit [Nitrospirota bacterium]|nr:hydrogenase iron-sulfur subunit [Nitrospirota bacterium]